MDRPSSLIVALADAAVDSTTPKRRRRLELASAVPIPSFAAGFMPSLGTPTDSGRHDMLFRLSERPSLKCRLHDALSIPDLPLAACSPHQPTRKSVLASIRPASSQERRGSNRSAPIVTRQSSDLWRRHLGGASRATT
ncbi:hypothetical protein TESG_07752 [Trichophyton tonsurans CBS 112818]|uniref:Uncharacterized protein n=1 Tax=Trichophyton tonsurans (strain CBS 112818) TaxID=647933 RepID=F2SA74_TRIT1|nr:hypothetical protein TESG_07752 [Trichophyton tonsurans CBS 112818]